MCISAKSLRKPWRCQPMRCMAPVFNVVALVSRRLSMSTLVFAKYGVFLRHLDDFRLCARRRFRHNRCTRRFTASISFIFFSEPSSRRLTSVFQLRFVCFPKAHPQQIWRTFATLCNWRRGAQRCSASIVPHRFPWLSLLALVL